MFLLKNFIYVGLELVFLLKNFYMYGSYRREIHEWRVTPRKARGVHERLGLLLPEGLGNIVFRGPHAPFVVSLAIRGFHVYMTRIILLVYVSFAVAWPK